MLETFVNVVFYLYVVSLVIQALCLLVAEKITGATLVGLIATIGMLLYAGYVKFNAFV